MIIVEPGRFPLAIRGSPPLARLAGLAHPRCPNLVGTRIITTTTAAPLTAPSVFGHPRGLMWLVITEAWERFSFYGMSALLGLYMLDALFLPGHEQQVAGLPWLRLTLEALSGALSTQALASQIFGLYSGFVFFTPVLGGLVADRWIGQRNAVVIGVLTMATGHVAMIFDRTFLVALLLLVIGAGLLKGNIAAQVGALYPAGDEARRARGFVVFSTGINVGAVLGPLLCGLLAQVYGWHYGFGAAAVLMAPALATYLVGYRDLPVRIGRSARAARPLGRRDWRTIAALALVIAIVVFPGIAYYQRANVFPVWLQDHVALDVGELRVPIAWFQSIDSLVSILAVPVLFWIWRIRARDGRESSDLGKIGWGAGVITLSNLVLVGAIALSGGERLGAIWPVLYCVGMGIGLIFYWPVALSLVSQAAPARVNSTMISLTYLSIFLANLVAGWLGSDYGRMGPLKFWALHALIAAAGGLFLLALRPWLARSLSSATLGSNGAGTRPD